MLVRANDGGGGCLGLATGLLLPSQVVRTDDLEPVRWDHATAEGIPWVEFLPRELDGGPVETRGVGFEQCEGHPVGKDGVGPGHKDGRGANEASRNQLLSSGGVHPTQAEGDLYR